MDMNCDIKNIICGIWQDKYYFFISGKFKTKHYNKNVFQVLVDEDECHYHVECFDMLQTNEKSIFHYKKRKEYFKLSFLCEKETKKVRILYYDKVKKRILKF